MSASSNWPSRLSCIARMFGMVFFSERLFLIVGFGFVGGAGPGTGLMFLSFLARISFGFGLV